MAVFAPRVKEEITGNVWALESVLDQLKARIQEEGILFYIDTSLKQDDLRSTNHLLSFYTTRITYILKKLGDTHTRTYSKVIS
jgi:hypothetical protein